MLKSAKKRMQRETWKGEYVRSALQQLYGSHSAPLVYVHVVRRWYQRLGTLYKHDYIDQRSSKPLVCIFLEHAIIIFLWQIAWFKSPRILWTAEKVATPTIAEGLTSNEWTTIMTASVMFLPRRVQMDNEGFTILIGFSEIEWCSLEMTEIVNTNAANEQHLNLTKIIQFGNFLIW